MNVHATFELGGSHISAAIVSSGQILSVATWPTSCSLEGFLSHVTEFVNPPSCDGISIAAAGVIRARREVIHSPNLPWLTRLALADIVEDRFHLPCCLANDMEALAFAELAFGELRFVRCGIIETFSTGVGGCTCLRIGEERFVIPAEPGHVVSLDDEGGPLCGCGQRGCNEARFSGGAVRRQLRKRFGNMIPGGIDPCAYLDKAAAERATWALKWYEEIGRGIGIAWANCLNRNSWIEKIVYSGTFAVHAMIFLREHIEQVIADRAMFPDHKRIEIIQSSVWPNGAHIGASMIFDESGMAPSSDAAVRINSPGSHQS